MAQPLPSRFDPDLLARDTTRYEAVFPIGSFRRLAVILAPLTVDGAGRVDAGTADALTIEEATVKSMEGEVRATAVFSRRKDHIVVGGRLRASYPLQCQRCLEPVEMEIDEPYELVFVESEAIAQALPDLLDPVVLDEAGQIRAVDLYEDELILHVPQIPRHENTGDCGAVAAALEAASTAAAAEAAPEKPRPFDVLKNLNLH